MKSKQERLDAAWGEYLAIMNSAYEKYAPVEKIAREKYAAYLATRDTARKEYEAECARISKRTGRRGVRT